MPNRKINKEIRAFIKERAAYSSDTAASIYKQVFDKFENPCSKATVERTVRSFRRGLAAYKLARTPSPLPNDETLAHIRGQRWRYHTSIPYESYAVYDQVVSMRQEIAELKEMIQILGQVVYLQADDSMINAIGNDEFGLFYEDEGKNLAKDYIEIDRWG
jgi:hypothetical protein